MDHYVIHSGGGNAQFGAPWELRSETKDERFFRISCQFRPWPEGGEIVALTGHLAENEPHEQEGGKPLSQRELACRLSADGHPVPQPHISRMRDTAHYLLPTIPNVLYGGLGPARCRCSRQPATGPALGWNRRSPCTTTSA